MKKMKKNLLIAFMLLAFLGVQAQTIKKVNPAPSLSKGMQIVQHKQEPTSTVNVPFKPYKNYPVNNKDIMALTKVAIGSSTNPYGILLESQNCAAYNPDLNLFMFTHRQTHTNPGNSGYIQTTFSTDGGTTFDNNIVYNSPNSKLGRYPSGVIYNPSGNTNPDAAFALVGGPYTDGSGWQGNYFASMKFDSTGGSIVQVDESSPDYDNLVRQFMNMDSQGRARLYGEKNTDDGTNYTSYVTAIMTGTFNSGTSAWEWVESLVVPDYTEYNSLPQGYRSPGMAWSKDGQTGYLVYVGRTAGAIDPLAYHPIIMKTTDGGGTWNTLPSIDWSLIPAINAELIPVTGSSGVKRAIFGLIDDAIVDANGRLHFAVMVNSAYSYNNPDSLGYYYAYQNLNGLMYHVYQTSTGWDAGLVDVIWAKDVDEANSPIIGTGGSPNVTWGYRMQMSKTPTEDMIAFSWMDTDTNTIDVNLYPDILSQVYNVNTGNRTPTKNITGTTAYVGDNYFLYVSEWAGYDAMSNEVILHMTTSDFGAQDVDPVYHSYLKDARVFVNITEFNSSVNGSLVVSQNYPNPFNDYTSIDITMKKASDVSVEVYNMMGQMISADSYQFVAGTHTVQLSAQQLSSGIYFFTVRAAEGTITKKMIVK